jgi:hypothetical protein
MHFIELCLKKLKKKILVIFLFLEEFSTKYKGTDDEKNDIIAFYNKNKGDIKFILEEIILSDNSDVPRYF